jgi:hypothetical protein
VRVLVLLILVAAAVGIVARVRYAAKQQRETVLARLSSETASTAPLSPTEELFRSEGIPVPDELRRGLVGGLPGGGLSPAPSAPPVPRPSVPHLASSAPAPASAAVVADRRLDLTELLAGMEPPAGLVPFVDPARTTQEVVTLTGDGDSALRDRLPGLVGAELERLGWDVSWIDGATALARRGDASAVVRIYDRAADLTGPNGAPLHPDLPPDRVVVTLTAG